MLATTAIFLIFVILVRVGGQRSLLALATGVLALVVLIALPAPWRRSNGVRAWGGSWC